jgi:hypothetical protein
MKILGLTDAQREAFMDLLIVGMYADHNLSSAEDARIQRALDTLEFRSDYERQQFVDACFTRVARQTGSEESIRNYVTQLASHFPAGQIQRNVYESLNDLITSDGNVTSEESKLLSAIRDAFHL